MSACGPPSLVFGTRQLRRDRPLGADQAPQRLHRSAGASAKAEARGAQVARRERKEGNRMIRRVAKIAYTFVMMNYAAVAGLFAATKGHRVWKG